MCQRATILRLLGCIAVVLAALAPHLPPWATAFTACLLGWQAAAVYRGWKLPSRLVRLGLAAAGFAGVFFTFGRINGESAGATLLCVMLALKFTELRTRRDCVVVLLLAYFVLATSFLFSQSIVNLLYAGVATWLITASLLEVSHRPGPLPIVVSLRAAGAMLLQALPLMLVLFVLFPRIPGPLWALPSGAGAHTGLSDSMTPGGIAHLARSGAVAFRVRFKGRIPPPDQRYWRGPVLWTFNGRTWRQGPLAHVTSDVPRNLQVSGTPTRYTVFLEPDNAHWLLALDMPVSGPTDAAFTLADEMRANQRVNKLRAYQVQSYLHYRLHPRPLPQLIRRLALSLPAGIDPRTRALVKSWMAAGYRGERLVKRALRYFHDQDFIYTLNPPALHGRNAVDEFMFDTRKGFCEHFASAFTFMMRVGGIPARVVTGYQGGQVNRDGDYLIVRQADAHAWSEVWLPGRGWVREDPTAAVDPARVQEGLGAALPDDPAVPPMARLGGGWIRSLKLRWDWVNTLWDQTVLAYGPKLQMKFLSRFGLGNWQRMTLALTALCTAFLSLLGGFILWSAHRRPRLEPVEREWRAVCRRLGRRGVVRRTGEGPRDFAARVAAARPRWAERFGELTRLYLQARYADDELAAHRFVRAARQFRPR